MAKKISVKSVAPDGYIRQGSIDDENFLYLYTQLTEFETEVKASLSSLESQIKSSFNGLVSGIGEMENTLSSRLSTINSTIGAQTTSIRAGLDAIVEVLDKEDLDG